MVQAALDGVEGATQGETRNALYLDRAPPARSTDALPLAPAVGLGELAPPGRSTVIDNVLLEFPWLSCSVNVWVTLVDCMNWSQINDET